jgi:hypothetical protein
MSWGNIFIWVICRYADNADLRMLLIFVCYSEFTLNLPAGRQAKRDISRMESIEGRGVTK